MYKPGFSSCYFRFLWSCLNWRTLCQSFSTIASKRSVKIWFGKSSFLRSSHQDLDFQASIRQSTAGFFRYPTNATASLPGFSPTCPSEREEPGKKVADEASCLEKNDTFFVRQTNWMLSCIRGSLKGNACREILVRVTSWCLGWVNIESRWDGLPPPLPKNSPPSLWFTAKKGYSASCHFYQLRSLQITTKLLLDCFCCI